MDKGGINKFGYLWDVIKSLVLPTSVVVALLAFNNDGGHNNVFLIAGCIALFIEIIAVVYISSKRSKSSEEQKKYDKNFAIEYVKDVVKGKLNVAQVLLVHGINFGISLILSLVFYIFVFFFDIHWGVAFVIAFVASIPLLLQSSKLIASSFIKPMTLILEGIFALAISLVVMYTGYVFGMETAGFSKEFSYIISACGVGLFVFAVGSFITSYRLKE